VKRASYRHAVAWIAHEDAPADGADAEAVEGYISVGLVADLFHVSRERVARDVVRYRAKHGI
jgi:hypothetical protein